jgi:hypothetical protein
VRRALIENGFRLGRTDALDAAQRGFVSGVDVDGSERLAEGGEHGRRDNDFFEHFGTSLKHRPVTITDGETPV